MKRALLIFSLSVLFLVPQNASAMLPGKHPSFVPTFVNALIAIPLGVLSVNQILRAFMSGISSPNTYAPLSNNLVEQDISCKKLCLVHWLLELVRERLLVLSKYDSLTNPVLKQHMWLAINIAMVFFSTHGESPQLSVSLYFELLQRGFTNVKLCIVRDERNGHIASHTFLAIADNNGLLWAIDPYLNAMMIPLDLYWTNPRFLLHFRCLLQDPNWVFSQELLTAFLSGANLEVLRHCVDHLRQFQNNEEIEQHISALNELAGVEFDSHLRAGHYRFPDDSNGDDSGESSRCVVSVLQPIGE